MIVLVARYHVKPGNVDQMLDGLARMKRLSSATSRDAGSIRCRALGRLTIS